MIQKHDASSLHYDFRLEIDGAAADARRNPVRTRNESVVSGRSMAAIARGQGGHD